ncbi:MAG TPA: RidA family protein [Hyphomicrobiaceae bacterium]|nr:RidA family protein [Hyphomicrobiaceae bacterium]
MRRINPDDIAKPASNYVQGVVHTLGGERLVISGQTGDRPDGSIEEGLEAQMRRAWSNLFGVLRAAGFEKRHLVKVTIFVTVPGAVPTARKIREEALEDHLCASTYLQVAGLARPEYLVEIEAEAVKE